MCVRHFGYLLDYTLAKLYKLDASHQFSLSNCKLIGILLVKLELKREFRDLSKVGRDVSNKE